MFHDFPFCTFLKNHGILGYRFRIDTYWTSCESLWFFFQILPLNYLELLLCRTLPAVMVSATERKNDGESRTGGPGCSFGSTWLDWGSQIPSCLPFCFIFTRGWDWCPYYWGFISHHQSPNICWIQKIPFLVGWCETLGHRNQPLFTYFYQDMLRYYPIYSRLNWSHDCRRPILIHEGDPRVSHNAARGSTIRIQIFRVNIQIGGFP